MRHRFLYGVFLGLLVIGAAPAGVQIQSGKLTVHAKGAPLKEVLGAITEQGGITFTTIGGGVLPEASVTEEFSDLSMEQGIARLLSKWDYALIKEEGTDRLKEVYIFASGSAEAAKPPGAMGAGLAKEEAGGGPADEEVRQAIEQVRRAHNPEEQAKALLNLQHFHDEQTLELLRPALIAPSPKVRMAALEAMYLRQVRDPEILEEIRLASIRDPDPAVREKALYISRHVVPDIVHEGDSTAFWMNP
jgi:hypothetical protein